MIKTQSDVVKKSHENAPHKSTGNKKQIAETNGKQDLIQTHRYKARQSQKIYLWKPISPAPTKINGQTPAEERSKRNLYGRSKSSRESKNR